MTKGIPKVPAAVTLMRLHSRKAAVSAPATDMTEHAAAVPADKLGGERHQPHLGFDRERNVEGRKPEPEHSALPFSEDEKRHFSFSEGSQRGVFCEDPTSKRAAVAEAGSALHVGSSCWSPPA